MLSLTCAPSHALANGLQLLRTLGLKPRLAADVTINTGCQALSQRPSVPALQSPPGWAALLPAALPYVTQPFVAVVLFWPLVLLATAPGSPLFSLSPHMALFSRLVGRVLSGLFRMPLAMSSLPHIYNSPSLPSHPGVAMSFFCFFYSSKANPALASFLPSVTAHLRALFWEQI